MRTAAIIGHGELGRQVEDMVLAQRRPDKIYFFDDNQHAGRGENTFPFDAFQDSRFSEADFYVALGYRHLVRKIQIINQLIDLQRNLPNLVHPTCHIAPDFRVGVGCILYPMCNVDVGVSIGNGVLLNNSAVVSHQCKIGNAVYISPGVVLCGRARVGNATFLGAGALVADGISIGSQACVAIGTVVAKDVHENASVIGNPMRFLLRPLRL